MASRNLKHHRSFDEDEEASLRLAKQLDAELNDSSLTAPISPIRDAHYDASLALAMQLEAEWNNQQPQGQTGTKAQSLFAIDTLNMSSIAPFSIVPQVSLRGGAGESRQQTTANGTFATLKQFVTFLAGKKCHKCNTSLIQGQNDVESLFKSWLAGQAEPSSILKCKRCSASTCIGCSSASGKKSPIRVIVKASNTPLNWCCGRGRMFLIWVLLCGFDQKFSEAKQREAAKTGTGRLNVGGGVGYGGSRMGGFGGGGYYGLGDSSGYPGQMFGAAGAGRYSQAPPDPSKLKAQSAQQQSDHFNKSILEILEELLPSLEKTSSFDMNPPEAVVDILLCSKALNYCTELLRNDSLEDATKRKDLYQALLSVVRVLGTHPVTAQKSVFTERILQYDAVNLITLSFQGTTSRTQKGTEAKTSSIADVLRNLNVQSNIMLNGASKNREEFETDEGQNLLWLCRLISDLSDFLLVNTKAGSGGGGGGGKTEAADQGITEASDEEIFATHAYANFAHQIQSPPGRMKRLITEITSLKTGLPPGIIVKYAASRMDVMKIAIVGPIETPYENGLFEFDLWCPQNYPHESPQVKFKGTGGGQVRLNPNLHSDGKVCLSLLGTWESGEPWRPAESTILQVLLSIQAMILCEEPYCNEPRLEHAQNTPESKAYNQRTHSLTVRYAMLNWLENPPRLWKALVTQHFEKNRSKIMETVTQWEQFGKVNYGRTGDFDDDPFVGRGPKESIASLKPKLQVALQNPGQGTPQNSIGYGGAYGQRPGGFGSLGPNGGEQRLGGSGQQESYGSGQRLGGFGPPNSRYGSGYGGPGSYSRGGYGGSGGYGSTRP